MVPRYGQGLPGDPRVTWSISRGVAPMPGRMLFRDPIEKGLRAVDHLVRLAHPVVEIAEFEFFAFERCQHQGLAQRRRYIAAGGIVRLGRRISRRGPYPSPACQHPGAAGTARRPRFRGGAIERAG
jgi:hypothetical protein